MRHAAPTSVSHTSAYFNLWMTPFVALNGLNPLLAGAAGWNHQAHEGFSTVALEWQDFIARRFKEDSHLVHKVAISKSLEEVWSAYAGFWKKAADDYRKEFAVIMNLATRVTTKGMAATQAAAEEGLRAFHVEKAA